MSFETLTDRTPSSFATGAGAAREEEQHVRGKRGEQQQSAAPHPFPTRTTLSRGRLVSQQYPPDLCRQARKQGRQACRR